MKVQKVKLPNSDKFTWTVLGDDYLPIQPIQQFLSYLKSVEKSPNTIRSYAYHLKLYWEYLGNTNKDWTKIKESDIADFIAWLRSPQPNVASIYEQKAKRTESTVNLIITSVAMLYDYQERLGVVTGVPLYTSRMQPGRKYKPFLHHISKSKPIRTKLIKLKEPKRLPKTLSKEEIQQLITACHRLRDKFLISLLYESGIRIGQALVINQLAYDCNICDNSGTPWRFQAHQFRHTVGTRMINLGVPQHIIQRFLGHETPEMTSVYAHIHDQTLKEEFAKFKHKMVDVTGKVVEPDNVKAEMTEGIDPNSIDEQWMRKNILAQALPNGLCGLPIVQGACPYGANKCLSCTHFKTDTRYLDKHKDHLERTTNIVEWAYENQDSRRSKEILKENLPVKENLERIITALEEAENEA